MCALFSLGAIVSIVLAVLKVLGLADLSWPVVLVPFGIGFAVEFVVTFPKYWRQTGRRTSRRRR